MKTMWAIYCPGTGSYVGFYTKKETALSRGPLLGGVVVKVKQSHPKGGV